MKTYATYLTIDVLLGAAQGTLAQPPGIIRGSGLPTRRLTGLHRLDTLADDQQDRHSASVRPRMGPSRHIPPRFKSLTIAMNML
jgi:hypothetical protein